MFEPFLVAPFKAKVAHAWIAFSLFLTAVSTLVTFESTLHTIDGPLVISQSNYAFQARSINFNWKNPEYGDYKRLHVNGQSFDSCSSAGDATLAFAIFSLLLCLILLIPMFVARIAGFNFPTVKDVQQSLNYEIIAMSVIWFCFFIQTCAWGVCFTQSRNVDGATVTGKGYGLIIACFFFQLFVTIPIYAWIRFHQEDWMIGIGANRSGARTDGIIYDQNGNFGDSGESAFNSSDANDENLESTVFSYKNEESKTSNGGINHSSL